MTRIQILEYQTAEGESPYRNWLSDRDVPVRARIQARVLRFEQGNLGDHKAVGKGVWEARLDFGPGYRLYFGKEGDQVVLLLMGGDKSTQRKDIKRAQEYWAEYLEEENGKKK